MKALLVSVRLCANSLTKTAADAFAEAAVDNGQEIQLANPVAEGFSQREVAVITDRSVTV